MAGFFSQEQVGYQSKPVVKPAVAAFGGRVRRYRATLVWNAFSPAVTTADNVYLGKIPAGAVFCFGVWATTVSLGTTTVSIGLKPSVHADNIQYMSAGTLTALNTPTMFGRVADPGANLAASFTSLPYGLTATWGSSELSVLPERDIYASFGVANPPSSANTTTIDLYFASP